MWSSWQWKPHTQIKVTHLYQSVILRSLALAVNQTNTKIFDVGCTRLHKAELQCHIFNTGGRKFATIIEIWSGNEINDYEVYGSHVAAGGPYSPFFLCADHVVGFVLSTHDSQTSNVLYFYSIQLPTLRSSRYSTRCVDHDIASRLVVCLDLNS